MRGVFVGAGFNAFGIASGGGAGMALAEWVAKGEPPYDLWPVDIRRFGRNHLDTNWVRTRTMEAYAKHYTMAWPFEEHSSGRPLRRSPLYDRLKAQGAVFGEKLGWERPNWFADLAAGEAPEDRYSYGRQNWFEAVGREHKACRERVARLRSDVVRQVLDGRARRRGGAVVDRGQRCREAAGLAHLYADAERARRHRMRSDRRARGRRTSTTSSPAPASRRTTSTGSRARFPQGLDARLIDVTSSYAVLAVDGPARARRAVGADRRDDVSNAGFPVRQARGASRSRERRCWRCA